MRRVGGVLLVLMMLVASGCGAASSEAGVDAVGGEGVERLLGRAAAAELSSFRMRLVAEFGGFEDFGSQTATFGVEGAFSEDGEGGSMTFDFGEVLAGAGPELAEMFGDAIEMRWIGSTVYMSSAFWAWLAPVDTPWVAFEDDGSGGVDGGIDSESFSAEEFLEMLRVVDGDAAIVGTERIDGVETTHVRGRVSASGLSALDPSFLEDLDPAGTGATAVEGFDLDVWIGPDDIVRRMRFGVDDLASMDPTAPAGSFFRFTLDLVDVGGPIEVLAPPDEEITWIDDIFGSFGFATPA